MKPHFFGPPGHALFGIYSPASGGVGGTGAVLCPPFGQEALRAHRALRLLAHQLSDAGVNVLRFDYFGTGDSEGDSRAWRPSNGLEDIRLAVQRVRELAAVRRVVLVGLRLGGLLAATAEARAVSRLILWDPVVDGREYVNELESVAAAGPQGEWQVAGFPLVPEQRVELASLGLGRVTRIPPDVRIMTTNRLPSLSELKRALEDRRARVTTEHIAAPPSWGEDGDFGVGAVPMPVLRKIVTWVN